MKKFSQKQQTYISVQEPKIAFLDVLHRVGGFFEDQMNVVFVMI